MAPGLRERKKAATRHALALAAVRLVVERGLDRVLVEDIAAAVDVSPRTFNNYFASKAEAVCAPAMDRARQVGEGLRARPATEPLWSAVTAVVLEVFTGAPAGRPGVPDRLWLDGLRVVAGAPAVQGEYLRVQDAVRRSVAAAVALRLGPDVDDLFPDVFGGAVAVACDTAMHRWLWSDPAAPLDQLLRRALDQVAAVARPPG